MLTTIPFCGFYESLHDSAIDDAMASIFSDSSGNAHGELLDRAWLPAGFKVCRQNYARKYAELFAKHVKAALRYESMKSPREYNFTTDILYCEIDESELRRLIGTLPGNALAEKARERFTSRDGFISFYSNDIEDWGDVSGWDHNQAGTVLECVADMYATEDGDEWSQWDESSLCEDLRCSGDIENWIFEGSDAEFKRLADIAEYLRQREERAYV